MNEISKITLEPKVGDTLSDYPTPIDSDIYYSQPEITGFEEYERAYEAYIEAERLPDISKPAISAANLFKRPELSVTEYVPGFIYAGAINLIAGEPKAGKSTLTWHITNAISLGKKFLGQEAVKSNVLYVTEQNEVSFRQETYSIPGFQDNENLFILMPEAAPPGSWGQHVDFWGQKLNDIHASVLVVDTFGSYANLPPGGENDAAVIADRLMELKKLFGRRPNLAVILVHHIRKPSTDWRNPVKEFADLRDARGSTAIVGGVDHCLMVSKTKAEEHNVRNIHIEGRFQPENKFSIVLTDKGYEEQNAFRVGRR